MGKVAAQEPALNTLVTSPALSLRMRKKLPANEGETWVVAAPTKAKAALTVVPTRNMIPNRPFVDSGIERMVRSITVSSLAVR
jgi:hypothetical protein